MHGETTLAKQIRQRLPQDRTTVYMTREQFDTLLTSVPNREYVNSLWEKLTTFDTRDHIHGACQLMLALNSATHLHGVEKITSHIVDATYRAIWYLNAGDPYIPTICVSMQRGSSNAAAEITEVHFCGWGDLLERDEAAGYKYD